MSAVPDGLTHTQRAPTLGEGGNLRCLQRLRVRAQFVHAKRKAQLERMASANAPKAPTPTPATAAAPVEAPATPAGDARDGNVEEDGDAGGDAGGNKGGAQGEAATPREGAAPAAEAALAVVPAVSGQCSGARSAVAEDNPGAGPVVAFFSAQAGELSAAVGRFQLLLTKVDDGSASFEEAIELERISDAISLMRAPLEPPPPPRTPALSLAARRAAQVLEGRPAQLEP